MSHTWAADVDRPSIERASAIDATDAASHYAIISPIYTGNGSGPQSYIRLFSGTGYPGTSSTFTVNVVGSPSGRTYGTGFSVAIPFMASIQYSIQDIIGLAGASALTSGDLAYQVYVYNADPEAGFQHAVYDWTTELFENMSNCEAPLNDQMTALHNKKILANVHTANVGSGTYPSTIYIHNYATTAKSYRLFLYNGGQRTSNGALDANSGRYMCDIGTTVQANATQAIPIVTFLANNSDCRVDTGQTYIDIALEENSGAPFAAGFTHTVRVGKFNGNVNMSAVCAINKRTISQVTASTTFQGTAAGGTGQSGTLSVTIAGTAAASPQPTMDIVRTQSVERQQASSATGTFRLTSGTIISLTGTYNPSTNGITLTGGGYTFTGTVAGSNFTGGFTGPGNTIGGFSTVNASTATVTAYCGTFGGVDDVGNFNMQVSGSTMTGLASDGVDPATNLYATLTGSTFSGRTNGGATFSGTISGTSMSGTFTTVEGNSGTFSGSRCAIGG